MLRLLFKGGLYLRAVSNWDFTVSPYFLEHADEKFHWKIDKVLWQIEKDANRDWCMYLDKKSFRLYIQYIVTAKVIAKNEYTLHFHRKKLPKHYQLLFFSVNLLGTTMWIISFFLIDSMACSTSFFNLLNGSWWQEWS